MLTWLNTWKQIEDSGVTAAVVPIGSTEQHGNNLPLATDSLLNGPAAAAIAERLGAYLVPQIPIGQSAGWLAYPGTLSLSPDTMKAVIADIVNSLARNGFVTIVFLSMHAGNDVIDRYLQEMAADHPSVALLYADLDGAFAVATAAAGIPNVDHADECEASMLASIRPDLVGPNPVDCPAPPGGYPKAPAREVSPYGSFGEPSKGSKAKGDKVWETLLRVVVDDIVRRVEGDKGG
jgi:creatinine amidohydrolase